MLSITNLSEVERGLDSFLAQARERITGAVRGMGCVLFKTIVTNSPQFSGDFAANWKFMLNGIDTSFTPGIFPDATATTEKISWTNLKWGSHLQVRKSPVAGFIAGSQPAIDHAMKENKGKERGFKLGDTINISNSAAHDEAYARLIEDGKVKFRRGNYPAPAGLGVLHVMRKYAKVGAVESLGLTKMKL